MDSFRGAISFNPSYADVFNYLGVALAESGDPEAALPEFRQALERNPDFFLARWNYGILLGETGREPDAARELGILLEREPTNPVFRQQLAAIGDRDRAAAENTGRLGERTHADP